MKPLIVLVLSFGLSCLVFFAFTHHIHFFFSGRIALAAMLLFTSVAHFVFNKGMTLMLPEFIPFKEAVIYLTGIMEIAAAVGLIIHDTYYITAILLILFFILLIPANIIAAMHRINLEKASYDGKGLSYLWFRVPLQLLFIGWTFYFAILN